MIRKITLPKLGQTVESAIIEKWVKKEGDAVGKGDVLCEITTDKATLEVESFYRGTLLRILEPEGAELPVGALIAVIGDPGEPVPEEILAEAGAPAPAAETAAPARAPAPEPAAKAGPAPQPVRHEGGRIFASPRARRRARELGVSLEGIQGSGPDGRIVEADVAAAAERAPAVKATPVARKVAAEKGVDLAAVRGTGVGGKITKEDVLKAPAAVLVPQGIRRTRIESRRAGTFGAGRVIPLTAMRRIVAGRMLESKRTVPCYYLQIDADVTDLVALRNQINARGGPKVGFNDFVLKACGQALRAFPAVNSRWVENGIERRAEVSVGLAVALDEGLIVPVVRNVDEKPLRDINAEVADLAERARSKKLRPEEYRDGCMTVSNLGMFGVKGFVPIVNPGESTILGLGMIQDRVVCWQGDVRVRKMMTLTLSVDHRLVDGAVGAQFLETIRNALEAPKRLVE